MSQGITLRAAKKGEVQTVTGALAPDKLQITMMHEHLLADAGCYFTEPAGAREKELAHQKVALHNLNRIRRNYLSVRDNLVLSDEATAIAEANEFKLAGGMTLVDVTNIGIDRDPTGLQRIARATGLNVVMGSGYYIAMSHPGNMDAITEKEIEEQIVRDVQVGVGSTDIRAGIIGELGCSWPLQPNEAKVLRAGAKAQRRTGAAITIHTGRHQDSPIQIAEVLRDAGADMSRVIMGHMDREWPDFAKFKQWAGMGCVIAFDTFGQETWNYPYAALDRLTDWQKVDAINILKAEGLLKQVIVSHDVGGKHRLSSFGGSGYHHILTTVMPVMRRKNLTDEDLQTLLIDTPRRLLTLV